MHAGTHRECGISLCGCAHNACRKVHAVSCLKTCDGRSIPYSANRSRGADSHNEGCHPGESWVKETAANGGLDARFRGHDNSAPWQEAGAFDKPFAAHQVENVASTLRRNAARRFGRV